LGILTTTGPRAPISLSGDDVSNAGTIYFKDFAHLSKEADMANGASAKNIAKEYTYADYLNKNETIRYEIWNGKIIMMAAPTKLHQRVSMELSRQIGNFLIGKPCEVFTAPFGAALLQNKGSYWDFDIDNPEEMEEFFRNRTDRAAKADPMKSKYVVRISWLFVIKAKLVQKVSGARRIWL
jgi:hypothetical protein